MKPQKPLSLYPVLGNGITGSSSYTGLCLLWDQFTCVALWWVTVSAKTSGTLLLEQ